MWNYTSLKYISIYLTITQTQPQSLTQTDIYIHTDALTCSYLYPGFIYRRPAAPAVKQLFSHVIQTAGLICHPRCLPGAVRYNLYIQLYTYTSTFSGHLCKDIDVVCVRISMSAAVEVCQGCVMLLGCCWWRNDRAITTHMSECRISYTMTRLCKTAGGLCWGLDVPADTGHSDPGTRTLTVYTYVYTYTCLHVCLLQTGSV